MIKTGVNYLVKKEVCFVLSISMSTLNRMVAAKSIPHIKIRSFTGNKVRVVFDQNRLEQWMKERIFTGIRN